MPPFVLSRRRISALREQIDGRVLAPGDPDYDAARRVFSGAVDRRPAVILRVAGDADVVRAIALAQETGLELAVRSGGHSAVGHSTTEGGIVVDLRGLTDLHVDVGGRSAWAGTGLTAGAYTTAVAEHGLATGFGDTGSVGIGGITLGGGIGYLVRKHGLTIDSLLAASLVTADGDVLHVDAESCPDLFWALRGGGGNFGVATRLHLRLHEVEEIYGGMLLLPAAAEVVTGFLAAAEAAPDELSTILNVMPAPPLPFVPAEHHGRLTAMALMAYVGPPARGEEVVAPFRELAAPLADLLAPMRYPELYPPDEEEYRPTAVGRTSFLDHVDVDVAGTVLAHLHDSDAAMRVAQLRVLGGAMARVPADATAFAHRSSRIMVSVAAFYDGPDDRVVREDWVRRFSAALHQGDDGAYVGFLGDDGPARIRQAYPGATWDRLAAVKARYDPANLFRLNHNVPPAPG